MAKECLNLSTRSSLESTGTLELRNCDRSVAIQLNSFVFEDGTSGFDITPSESLYKHLQGFNIYSDFDLSSVLSENITEQEAVTRISNGLAAAIHHQCMKCPMLTNPFVDLCLSMIGTEIIRNHGTLWCWKDENGRQVLIELPIITPQVDVPSSSSSSSSMDYFLDAFGQDVPYICILLKIDKEIFEVSIRHSRKFPSLEKLFELPTITRDTLLSDYLNNIRFQFQQNLLSRKKYIEELGKIACCPEFNAIDFSFVSLLIRLKYNKLFTMFLVNIKILPKFPIVAPVITIYDLQSTSIILVEQSQLQWWNNVSSSVSNSNSNSNSNSDSIPSDHIRKEDCMKRLATETIVFICDLMNERAFPGKQKDCLQHQQH